MNPEKNEASSSRLTALEITRDKVREYTDALQRAHDRTAKNIFVVMNREETTCLVDPGLQRPFSTRQFKYAEHVAKAASRQYPGCHVMTLERAIDILMQKAPKS